jgi:hypothetical protein
MVQAHAMQDTKLTQRDTWRPEKVALKPAHRHLSQRVFNGRLAGVLNSTLIQLIQTLRYSSRDRSLTAGGTRDHGCRTR